MEFLFFTKHFPEMKKRWPVDHLVGPTGLLAGRRAGLSHASLLLFFFLWFDVVEEPGLPTLADKQNKIREDDQEKNPDHNKIQPEKTDTFGFRAAHGGKYTY